MALVASATATKSLSTRNVRVAARAGSDGPASRPNATRAAERIAERRSPAAKHARPEVVSVHLLFAIGPSRRVSIQGRLAPSKAARMEIDVRRSRPRRRGARAPGEANSEELDSAALLLGLPDLGLRDAGAAEASRSSRAEQSRRAAATRRGERRGAMGAGTRAGPPLCLRTPQLFAAGDADASIGVDRNRRRAPGHALDQQRRRVSGEIGKGLTVDRERARLHRGFRRRIDEDSVAAGLEPVDVQDPRGSRAPDAAVVRRRGTRWSCRRCWRRWPAPSARRLSG